MARIVKSQNCPKLLRLSKIVKNVKIVENYQNCQNCQTLSKLSKIVKIVKNCQNCQKTAKYFGLRRRLCKLFWMYALNHHFFLIWPQLLLLAYLAFRHCLWDISLQMVVLPRPALGSQTQIAIAMDLSKVPLCPLFIFQSDSLKICQLVFCAGCHRQGCSSPDRGCSTWSGQGQTRSQQTGGWSLLELQIPTHWGPWPLWSWQALQGERGTCGVWVCVRAREVWAWGQLWRTLWGALFWLHPLVQRNHIFLHFLFNCTINFFPLNCLHPKLNMNITKGRVQKREREKYNYSYRSELGQECGQGYICYFASIPDVAFEFAL